MNLINQDVKIKTIDKANLDQLGFFCYKSKRKTTGYAKKRTWLNDRLDEGLRLHILYETARSKGFIEAIPGEYAWRAVTAQDYLFIHCIWVVGKAKGKGYGLQLLSKCIKDAVDMQMKGVAVLASEETWLTGRAFFQNAGFEVTDTAKPAFSLMALNFDGGSKPSLPSDWQARIDAFGSDLTLVYADQCPYIDRMKQAIYKVAESLRIPAREVCLTNSKDVQSKSPSPYGIYNIVFRGEIIASHPVGTDALLNLVRSRI
jgi:N-acetylglutamate synthase-like GNAT family acetyltransferase